MYYYILYRNGEKQWSGAEKLKNKLIYVDKTTIL